MKSCPQFCLNLVLRQVIEDVGRLQNADELKPSQAQIDSIRKEDPDEFYDNHKLIYKSYCNYGVYRTYNNEDGKAHIMKITHETMENEKDVNRMKSEIFLLMRINSDYILKPRDIFAWNDKLIIITEEMDYGSLEKVIEKFWKHYSEEFCKYLIYMVACGLKELHEMNILHRDLKSDNILADSEGVVKITDLGCSAQLTADKFARQTVLGSDNWKAPELIRGESYNKEVDIWAFGAFCYELANGEPPFKWGLKDGRSVLLCVTEDEVPKIPEKWSDQFNELIQDCLKKDRQERPSIDDIL